MRIVRMVSLYPPYIVGGNEMLTRDIVEALIARGCDVHVLTAHGPALDGIPCVHQVFNYSLEDKDIIFQGTRRLRAAELVRHYIFDPITYRNVRETVRGLRPDLIVADNLFMTSVAPLVAVRDAACPVIAQVADKWLLFNMVDCGLAIRPQKVHHRAIVGVVRETVQRPLARHTRLDGIITVSDFIRDLYMRAGFEPSKLHTKYLGIHTDMFYPGPAHPLGDPVRLLFVGGLWEGKGLQVVIEAMKLLASTDDLPRFRLDVLGDGAEGYKRHLERHIQAAGIGGQVHFHGFVSWDVVAQMMRTSDIFVFGSIWDEPFAITPLQALGCGLPVVATTAGGTPEGFTDRETALLIPPNDSLAMAQAIALLVRDQGLRHRLRENGLSDVHKRWAFTAYVDRLLEFYTRTVHQWHEDAAQLSCDQGMHSNRG